ncbi:BZ3500_MvSof-1268-A1-R1_Chr2-2g05039 [Microbotryum saponariae]|uniref:Arginine biosynthesis bifunctional protein ArgJ, mitochondrial n=1 Tax=Microbotryum saponariae TaxID=289078 RepID=A0A2X0L2H5_9BASI|nr:BZ3500_MvSof-1268-A1-R1_Chr2-2g05039 [Microbotryum saponariae]SDA00761.1 BZ3501_MvSof-1269-A2-R1_Chr2-2g04713 [Microbotryum saponariae]
MFIFCNPFLDGPWRAILLAPTLSRCLIILGDGNLLKSQRFAFDPTAAKFPLGFVATGLHCGVKKDPSRLDLGVIISDRPCSAAGTFTRNAFVAAPVVVSKEVLAKGRGIARGLVVNSGCANAVTGSQGLKDARAMSDQLDSFLGESNSSSATGTLVMSTGVIGQLLPIKKILNGITSSTATLGSTHSAWLDAAKAFMTTDTFPKLRTRSFEVGGKEVRMVGIDKGAGMIHPNMGPPHATLLGMIATDAAVTPASLQDALTYAVDRSFNSISVDGDMSTNDTIVVLANGASGSVEISEKATPDEYVKFRDQLTDFAAELAQLVVRDGEGAEKFVKITAKVRSRYGSPTYEAAHKIASTISTSALVKCAMHGEDANWGRILCAVGYSNPGFDIDPTKVTVSFVPVDGSAELKLLVNGEPEQVDEARASEILKSEDLAIQVDLGLGDESATYWTCDFSHEYISINAGE